MSKSWFFILLLAIPLWILHSCKEKTRDISKIEASPVEPAKPAKASWPQPNRYLGSIPVYETFDEIEPLFRQQSDTAYVVNFWATWCKPCIEELPYFEELSSSDNNELVKVVLVSLDFPKHLESKLLPFVEEWKLESEVDALLDGDYNSWIDRVSPEWSGAIPATYIYKKDTSLFIGEPFDSYDDLMQSVNKIL